MSQNTSHKDYTNGKSFFEWLKSSFAEMFACIFIHVFMIIATIGIFRYWYGEAMDWFMIIFVWLTPTIYWIMQLRTYRNLKKGIST